MKHQDPSYQLLAARHIRRQIKQLVGQFDGIRQAEDIEFVHRARVATRRLRAGLKLFQDCFPAKRVKGWREEVRRLSRGLADARDKDVQIEFLCGMLREIDDARYAPGITRILARWEKQRESLQPEVIAAIDRLLASGVLDAMLGVTKAMLADAEKREAGRESPFIFYQTGRHILGRFEELMLFEPCLARPDDYRQHHAMRIAAKRLRYTIEAAIPAYAGRLDAILAAMKQLQSLLGELHDCDVWTEQLVWLLAEERQRIVAHYGHSGPLARLKVGIDYLQANRRARRGEIFAALVAYWNELGDKGIWKQLVETIRWRDEPAAAGPAEPLRTVVAPPAIEPAADPVGDAAAASANEARPQTHGNGLSPEGADHNDELPGNGQERSRPRQQPGEPSETTAG
jgi:CHAD domain-containing protein